jgi:hypothetical protein
VLPHPLLSSFTSLIAFESANAVHLDPLLSLALIPLATLLLLAGFAIVLHSPKNDANCTCYSLVRSPASVNFACVVSRADILSGSRMRGPKIVKTSGIGTTKGGDTRSSTGEENNSATGDGRECHSLLLFARAAVPCLL